jgi:inner membrane protein
MPNRSKHMAMGAIVGGVAAVLIDLALQNQQFQQGEINTIDLSQTIGRAILGAGIGAVGGILPDILEPATDPNHRKSFHSVAALYCLGFGLYKTYNGNLSIDAKHTITGASLAYASHLLLDAETPMGLPVI